MSDARFHHSAADNGGTTRLTVTAMTCAAAVTAQFVSGKATRDALFLASLHVTSLPAMLVATSICSILLVALNTRASRRFEPGRFVPVTFALSGALCVAEWLLTASAPSLAAVLVYLHISCVSPLLTSGFWLIASERFDPRTAKKRFGQIAAAGTVGGLLSALIAERIAAVLGMAAMLPALAALQLLSGWLVRNLARGSAPVVRSRAAADHAADSEVSGLQTVLRTPYLRHLSALVLFGTTSAALVDYLFKAHAVETFGQGDHLLRFFAIYYAATSVVTFVVQTTASRWSLERCGLALTTSTPSLALVAGSLGSLVAPGFASVLIARAGEAIFRGSLFRAGYELFYTPIPAREKRAAKSIIDVAFDRLGDAVGGGMVRVIVLLAPAAQAPVILVAGLFCAAVTMFAASRLNRGYIRTLENSLIDRGSGIDGVELGDLDSGTRELMLSAVRKSNLAATLRTATAAAPAAETTRAVAVDPDLQDIVWLRSRDRDRVLSVLCRDEDLPAMLIPHVIPLLAWDAVAEHAVFALRKVAEERVGELIDALLDPNQDFSVRRRLARVFSVCVSQRAADGLMFGLEDPRFDVRCQSARSLASLVDKNPLVRINRELIEAAVLREVTVGRPVWESRRLLEGFDEADHPSAVDAFVRDRAGESLAHVFTLLSLMLPREPLQIAFRSLHTDDAYLRGTALEYLDEVLPPAIRDGLWPFLERTTTRQPRVRPRDEIIADLLRSNHSILVNLEELRRRTAPAVADMTA